jgi:hypothetical protein
MRLFVVGVFSVEAVTAVGRVVVTSMRSFAVKYTSSVSPIDLVRLSVLLQLHKPTILKAKSTGKYMGRFLMALSELNIYQIYA